MTLPSSVVMHLARLTLHDEEWSHHYHTYTVRLALAFGTGHVQFVVQELLALIVSNLAVLVVLTVLVVLAVPEFLVVLVVLMVLVALVGQKLVVARHSEKLPEKEVVVHQLVQTCQEPRE